MSKLGFEIRPVLPMAVLQAPIFRSIFSFFRTLAPAGPPLITIDVTPELSIQKDSEAEITLKNLTLSTNMNIQVSAINWFLVEEPQRGAFYVDGVKVRQWKHGHVMAGNVIFKHTSREKNYKDSFIIKAYHSRLESTELKVDVNYYMEHYQLPLKE